MNNIENKSVEQLLQEADWKLIYKELLAFAGYKLPNYQAEFRKELVQETIKKVLMGEQEWKPKNRPKLLNHLKLVFISVMSNELRSAYRTKRAYISSEIDESTIEPLDTLPANDKPIDKVVEDADTIEKIFESVKGDEIAELVLLCLKEGATSSSEIAEELGININEVRNAQRRIRYKAIKINK